jgi:hypothetical protein
LKKTKPSSVNAISTIADLITGIDEHTALKNIINKAIGSLSENFFAGIQIEKNKIPKYYVENYGVNNLFVFRLDSSRRLIYTLIRDSDGVSVNIIEIFLDHKQYENRFGYS